MFLSALGVCLWDGHGPFWMATEIICHQSILAVNGADGELVRDKRPAPSIFPQKGPVGVYVDNIHCFGGQKGEGCQRMQLIASHFEKLGIPFEVDGHDGRQSLDSLGMTFDLSSGVRVRAKKDRAWRLFAATRPSFEGRESVAICFGSGLGMSTIIFCFVDL